MISRVHGTLTALDGSAPRPVAHWIALLCFGLAAALTYGELFTRGARDVIPVQAALGERVQLKQTVTRADAVYQMWLVSRNARTLTTRPHRLFDAEHCAPVENTLTLGVPMVTLGMLAIPGWLASGDPVLSYNLALVTLSLVGALVMYGVVFQWTGVAAAGIAAGILYGFDPIRLRSITHPAEWDATWILLGLFFAERLFARGRWRDAWGLAAATALQIGASFYTLLAAVFATPPFLGWLLYRHRLRHVKPAQLLFVAAAVALAAAALLGPYLEAASTRPMQRSAFQMAFAPLGHYLPGGALFPGFLVLALAAGSLLFRPRELAPRISGDPRLALVAGAVCLALVISGPRLYTALADVLPGLESVRVVKRMSAGVQLLLVLLAGLAAGALIRRSGRAAPFVAAALVLLAALDGLRGPHSLAPRYLWAYESVRPDAARVEFFEALARLGNTGPILELPVDRKTGIFAGPDRILLSAYHRRRTSACYGSYFPAQREQLAELARQLPLPDAVAALRQQGFTTVVLHREGIPAIEPSRTKRLERAARRRRGIAALHRTEALAAYELLPD